MFRNISLVTGKELHLLIRGERSLKENIKTVAFTLCGSNILPPRTLTFPHVETVFFLNNDKYFQDYWVMDRVFPSVKEMWIWNVPGGFMEFPRPEKVNFVVTDIEARFNRFPPGRTRILEQKEWWKKANSFLDLPEDLMDEWGCELNPKYVGEDGVNVFF